MQEEHQNRGASCQAAQIEFLAANRLGLEAGRLGVLDQSPALEARYGDAKRRPKSLRDGDGCVLGPGVEARVSETHVSLGIGAENDEGPRNPEQCADIGVGVVDDGKIETMILGEGANLGDGTPHSDPHDLEVMARLFGSHVGDRVSHCVGTLGFRVEEEEHDALADQRRHGEPGAGEGSPVESRERALPGRPRCSLPGL